MSESGQMSKRQKRQMGRRSLFHFAGLRFGTKIRFGACLILGVKHAPSPFFYLQKEDEKELVEGEGCFFAFLFYLDLRYLLLD